MEGIYKSSIAPWVSAYPENRLAELTAARPGWDSTLRRALSADSRTMFGSIVSVLRSMGTKPMFGMSLPAGFTAVQCSGVYFNNVRRHEMHPGFNKFQNDGGLAGFETSGEHPYTLKIQVALARKPGALKENRRRNCSQRSESEAAEKRP